MVRDKAKASWDINTTKLFIDLCLEQVKKGRRKGTSFKKDGWDEMGKRFTELTGREYEKSQFKNKFDSMRKDWTTWHKLVHETGVGWDNEKNTVAANDDWWEKKISENPNYKNFRTKGLQNQVELAELFGDVAATGPSQWAPSSNMLPNRIEPSHVYDSEEGSGDSDEVTRGRTGLSAEFNSVTVDGKNKDSGGDNQSMPGTSAADKSTCGNMTTSSLGVKRKGNAMKKKGSASTKIADVLSMMVEEARIERTKDNERAARMVEEARAARMAEEARAARMAEAEEARAAEARAVRMEAQARAYEISIVGVINHLKQVSEVVCDEEFYARCTHFLMRDPPAREVYAALKDTKEQLLVFLRHECGRK